MKFTRRKFLGLASASVLIKSTGLRAQSGAAISSSKPLLDVSITGKPINIIWIVWDTARRSNHSLYGYSRRTTPGLERLVQKEKMTVYRNARSTCGWTIPSHASMFTGVYPAWHGALSRKELRVSRNFPTLAELLGSVGYQTINITGNILVSRESAGRGFEIEHLLAREFGWPIYGKNASIAYQLADRWVAKERNPEKPFFLFINNLEPHDPWHQLDPINLSRFSDPELDVASKLREWKNRGVLSHQQRYSSFTKHFTESDLDIVSAFYDANISYLDMYLQGYLPRLLKKAGPNTMVIITADHGECLGEHGIVGHHSCLYESLCQVPLCIRFPEGFEQTPIIDAAVSHLDLLPTIADIMGLDWAQKNQLQGEPLLNPTNLSRARTFVVEDGRGPRTDSTYPHGIYGKRFRYIRGLYSGQFKYIWKDNGQEELYDLGSDPLEAKDLSASHPEDLRRLKKAMDLFFRDAPYGPERRPTSLMTGDDREALEALGYLQN